MKFKEYPCAILEATTGPVVFLEYTTLKGWLTVNTECQSQKGLEMKYSQCFSSKIREREFPHSLPESLTPWNIQFAQEEEEKFRSI